ncbi:MAG: alpha/beta hydrolase fold domain-containing protein, partial [Candidatus Binatia bacterium]
MASQELQTLIQQLRAQPLLDLPLEELRRTFDGMAFPLDADVSCQPVDAGGVRCEWITPPAASRDRVILYLHGGGYVIGSIVSHRALVANVARAAGARGLAVAYRLAPECPFPAAVEDATAAYRWLLSTGVDPKGVVIAGDSAGGG